VHVCIYVVPCKQKFCERYIREPRVISKYLQVRIRESKNGGLGHHLFIVPYEKEKKGKNKEGEEINSTTMFKGK
jgi:hypothetical protein